MPSSAATPATRFVALLRGINVGGHKPVGMAALRALLTDLGFGDVRSVLQSGNLVFSSSPAARPGAGLEQLLETEAGRRLGLEADFFVRSDVEWAKIVAGNPFRDDAARDPGHLVAVCLKAAPAHSALESLRQAVVGRERIAAAGNTLYVVYPDGVGRSRLSHAVIEKWLTTRGTGRNWNTVLRLATMVGSVQR